MISEQLVDRADEPDFGEEVESAQPRRSVDPAWRRGAHRGAEYVDSSWTERTTGMKRMLSTLVLGLVAVLALGACSTIEGAKKDVENVQAAAGSCGDAIQMGKDMIDLMLAGLNSGAIAFENSGQFIDAVTAMDTKKVDELGKQVGAGLPEADGKKFREKLDAYGAAVKKCRTQS